ncbi:MAG TPA: hypothetical protein PLP19_10700 [bacterium]|nr:hypothetical protein [bacterium]HPN43948.1 hypothetical protein [bacterium]
MIEKRKKQQYLNSTFSKIKPWDFRNKLIATYIEFIRLMILIIALCIIIIPIIYIKHQLHTSDDLSIEKWSLWILTIIELLISILICVLFSIGLIVLMVPDFAKGIPKWMLQFRNISSIDRSLLGLITTTLIVHVVSSIFESIHSSDGNFNILSVSISSFLILISIAILLYIINNANKK